MYKSLNLLGPIAYLVLLLHVGTTFVLGEALTTLHQQETVAEFRYQDTLITYVELIVAKTTSVIVKQEVIITFQRRIIDRLGRSPCPERIWLAFDEQHSKALSGSN